MLLHAAHALLSCGGRGGRQVLPVLTEVIAGFDFSLLDAFWHRVLASDDNDLCWGGYLTLKVVAGRKLERSHGYVHSDLPVMNAFGIGD